MATQKSKASPSPVPLAATGAATRGGDRPAAKRPAAKPARKPVEASAPKTTGTPAPRQTPIPAPASAPPTPAAGPVARVPGITAATASVLTSVTGSPIQPISLLFDPVWYLKTYPDVAAAGLDPIRHFFEDGAREGRDPNAHFKTEWYLAQNQDVVASKVNPFLHYLLYGAREGRRPAP